MITMGEVYRTKEQQLIYYKKGLTKTLQGKHLDRLAADLNVFRNGKLLTTSEDLYFLGLYWESLDKRCIWGGDWDNDKDWKDEKFRDPGHFQLT